MTTTGPSNPAGTSGRDEPADTADPADTDSGDPLDPAATRRDTAPPGTVPAGGRAGRVR